MSTRHERMNDKVLNERNAKILKALLALPENRTCADCKRRDPRWASHNIGIFVCLRCSGIHRSLGVHISKMKSADLDSWTPEQVNNMISWGNARANWWWEARATFEPNDSNIELYIRCKYERRQFIRSEPIPDPKSIPVGSWYDPANAAVNQTSSTGSQLLLPNSSTTTPNSLPQQPFGFAAFADFSVAPTPTNCHPNRENININPVASFNASANANTNTNANANILDLFSTPNPTNTSNSPAPAPVVDNFTTFTSFPPPGNGSVSRHTTPKVTSIPKVDLTSAVYTDILSVPITKPIASTTTALGDPLSGDGGFADFGAFNSSTSQIPSPSNLPKLLASTITTNGSNFVPIAGSDLFSAFTSSSPTAPSNPKLSSANHLIFGDIFTTTSSSETPALTVPMGMGGQPAASPAQIPSKPDPFNALGVFGGIKMK